MIRTMMTWQAPRRRWRKWYKGLLYQVSCDQLGCTDTKADSYQAANAWWMAKKAEIDSQQPSGKWSYEIETLEKRRDWARAHGEAEQAAGYTGLINDLSHDMMDDLPSSIVRSMVFPSDQSNAVWQDRLSRDQLRVPEERLMGKQIKSYLELQMARAKTKHISVPEYDQIRVCLNAFTTWVGEESMIDSISPDRWEAWYVHLLGSDISVEYKKQFRHSRNFLMWMAEKGLILPPLNLHARRYRFTGGHKRVPTIPMDEVRKIFVRARGVLRLHLLLLLNCGMTQQDVSDLHPGEVDWEIGRITRRRSKTEKLEQTPIVCYKLWNETFRLLTEFGHRDGDHVLLTHTGRPWVRDDIVNNKRKRSDSVKSLYVHLKAGHNLKLYRKTGATILNKQYPDCVELYLGHAPRTVTQRSYVDPDVQRFDHAIEWLGQQFGF
jgi:integrase